MTVLRVAIGLTMWFAVISVLVLSVPQLPDSNGFELASIFITQSYFLLMPVRWALVLTLLIRAVRAIPLKLLPRAPLVQVTFVTLAQVVLGVLSLTGCLALWVSTSTGDRVFGFVLHVVFPSLMVAFLARRARRLSRQSA